MDRQSLAHFRQKLLEEKAGLEEQLDSLNSGGLGESLLESTQELSRYDNHPGDLGTEEFERGKDLALRDNVQVQLRKIEDALQSIAEGTYGYCRRCGREIPRERLEAIPETTLCLECRRKMEGKADKHSRPVEEAVILPPFGGQTTDPHQKHADEEEAVEYDGEDVWQELGRTIEHASEARSGSYFGPLDLDEDQGFVEAVENIPYFRGADGMFYEDTGAYLEDEGAPEEKVIGDAGWDRVLKGEEDREHQS
ncbi:TraR/DksA C4-type zinc finger protein [Neomoorella thermoacetica]|uniref:General stress protein 16O n=1 Tax=Neomoorella thermoacetica TaxID=1525 RepID=A0A5D3I745_NEOTH|nr:TraR/DksA C4-type zinc finger protein [Moorella thermoacetica]AOQ23532.1 General stress protein 16O [Moorella thermoacetica]APC07988.1 general stress protein 16O [Moorella thermoacetica]OIQ11231.1 general stress protein 16O [Moorella thermoacetica]TYL13716.1 RNA polymerase-binding transcription factor DksA [Moorella thermoacetica]